MKNRQRGNIYFWFLGVLILALAVWKGIEAWNSYTEELIAGGVTSGKATCDATYKERDNKQLQDDLLEIARLTKAKTDAEAHGARVVKELAKQLVEAENANVKLADQNRLLTGSRGVRESAFVVQGGECPAQGDSRAASQAPGPGAGDHAAATCDLSPGTKQRVRDIGLRCDKTALQLAAAQELILKDRELCGAIK